MIATGPPPGNGWCVDDLEGLAEDGFRRELLDGVLLTRPSPTDVHQIVVMRLMVALEASCPAMLQVTQGVELRIGPRMSFVPDVLVATEDAARRLGAHYGPHEVVLAVEVADPTSQTMDRVTKLALYAAAGVPHYWVIETDRCLRVNSYKIDPAAGGYRPTGVCDLVIEAVEPWPISIPISRLTPRFL